MAGDLTFIIAVVKGEVAPKSALRLPCVERVKPTPSGRSLPPALQPSSDSSEWRRESVAVHLQVAPVKGLQALKTNRVPV
jgi:hypothetical protein